MSNFQGGNINIITLIKEIYGALRNLEAKYYELNDNLNKKMSKLDSDINGINMNIEQVKIDMKNLNDKFESVKSIDTNIGLDLESQMRQLNNNIKINSNNKINLDISELTIDNLIDNNYTINDINNISDNISNISEFNISTHTLEKSTENMTPAKTSITLDNLLF